MKKQLLLFMAGAFTASVSGQTILINETFDTHTSGDMVAETIGLPWSTWSGAVGGSEDTPISDEQANSGTLSMKVTGNAAGGPTDLMLRLGNNTSGTYGLSWNMYIPSGNGGYFNIQHNEVPGSGSWMFDAIFLPGGAAEYVVDGDTTDGTFPHDAWFSVGMVFDLGTSTAVLAIDGAFQYTWQTNVPGPNQLGGIDFFAFAGGAPSVPVYYVDDVLFVDLTTSVQEVAPTVTKVYPNPTLDVVTVELPYASSTAVVSLIDVTGRKVMEGRSLDQRGTYARTQLNLTGLPDGLYFVRIQDGDTEVVRRVTKH